MNTNISIKELAIKYDKSEMEITDWLQKTSYLPMKDRIFIYRKVMDVDNMKENNKKHWEEWIPAYLNNDFHKCTRLVSELDENNVDITTT